MRNAEGWAVSIVIAAVAGFLVYTASEAIGRVLALPPSSTSASEIAAETFDWQDYHNATFDFDVHYPPGWDISTAGLGNATPFVAFGNPLDGTKSYAVEILIENNPNSLSSGEYVHELLAADRAQDAASGANEGLATPVTPHYKDTSVLQVGESSYEAYELSDVYEADHNAEQIYVADGNTILLFDFPVAQENPNISLPVANNAIAHEIVNTLTLGS
jgi:hypothetical protein